MMTERPTPAPFRIKGRWLRLARSIWIILTLIAIAFLIAGVCQLYIGWHEPCSAYLPQDNADCFKEDQVLRQFGVTRDFYAVYFPIGVVMEILPWLLAGILIFSKISDEPFGFLFSLMLVVSGTFNLDAGVPQSAVTLYPVLAPFYSGMAFIGGSLLVLCYCFPNRRFVPRWMMSVAVLWVILEAGANLFQDTLINYNNWPYPLPDVIVDLMALSIIYSFVDRYRHTSDRIQIQQIKWVVLSGCLLAVMKIIPSVLFNPYVLPWNDKVAVIWYFTYSPLWYLSMVFVAMSLVFSILRYRLWDIDFILNRSLVYFAMTAILAILFGGSLFLVSLFVQGQSFIIAFGVTAMVAGTSFNPTRRRIQRFVDRTFYHIEIDYQKTPPGLAAKSMSLVLPQTHFGQYQGLELIGRGGMAEVYKANHPSLGIPVAIKVLPTALAGETEIRHRFVREAQVISTLVHPNIVRIFDSGDQDGQLFIVMEFLAGKDLDQLIKTNGRLPLAQALPLVQQIASALDYSHAAGFVHRDIKPSNILLEATSSGSLRAVLTDFGIAKINSANTVVTVTGYMLGTFDYIAPEQIQESSHVDGRADIYALGVMVYQMLTGQLPFKHSNPGALLIAHLTQPAPDACEILSDLPRDVSVAIQHAMAKKPENRYGTATEFAVELSRGQKTVTAQ